MFNLARQYGDRGMVAYAGFQDEEFKHENEGYVATSHQGFIGVMASSTEEAQFN